MSRPWLACFALCLWSAAACAQADQPACAWPHLRGPRYDAVSHEIASDPHPVHTQCPELNGPVLLTGNSFTATMAGMPETCGFHDHLHPTDTAFQGTITVR